MQLIGGDETKVGDGFARVPLTKLDSNIHMINSEALLPQALPMELMMPQSMIGSNKVECQTCQYFLHYVQQELTSPASEAEIKEFVDEACDHLPKSIGPQCRSFVATYGDALVALLAQEVDPSQVQTIFEKLILIILSMLHNVINMYDPGAEISSSLIKKYIFLEYLSALIFLQKEFNNLMSIYFRCALGLECAPWNQLPSSPALNPPPAPCAFTPWSSWTR